MGTCINKKTLGENELFTCCNLNTSEFSKTEILCGKEQIEYYLNNKITDLTIDFLKRTIIDTSSKSSNKEIKVPESYFLLLESYAKINQSTPDGETEIPSSHLSGQLSFPIQFDSESVESLTTRINPSIENSLHPVISKPLTEIDTRNPNLIFNDLIQETFITRNEKLENLIKKFLLPRIDSYQTLIESLIKIYTHDNGLHYEMNKVLKEERKKSFLGSSIILLNDAIRSNFCDLRFESKCYRKANLTQSEFDQYFNLFNNSEQKTFLWKTFTSATKTIHADIRNNANSSIYESLDYNTIFTIEFSSDSWGLDISNISLSKYDDEVLLPANSIFEIVNLFRNEKDQIIHIGLVKLDKNIKARASALNNTWVGKGSKIIEKEINLLQNDLQNNSHKYCFVKDDDNMFKLKFALLGPAMNAYANGTFQVNVFIPEGYPNKAPNIKFATKIYHPNISYESGDLDKEILEKIWRPSLSIAKFINIIHNLLIEPNQNYENLNTLQKKEYLEDRDRFVFNAIEVTRRFAQFGTLIAQKQRENNSTELQARIELLKENAYETIV